ncbi:family 43 glycosylhydrolase [Pseudoduganella namucuonensis]|uniref:Xylan 1,4-beta-xylosidase n=1 Tax=Pseudoduganella namucuonensis TaxID=1035707 RepID=A0A1I7K7U9_9BURK|nr:family 43 glycosylhydrolase [Pseudoduganella namucuonensis]SFU93524.1 xylan 1,4-beta-xylosidase [Pseudoduganella namucuonensis]
MKASRRTTLKALLAGAAIAPQVSQAAPARACATKPAEPVWAAGIEGQRKADLGNGTFLNPIIAGDHPDPTILKDGADYYMTFSSFFSYPGAIIWHSRDLVNWAPIGPALTKPLGSVWAMDLIKHNGRYFIYIPADPDGKQSIFVIWADDIKGPWSEPVDLKISGAIDPGHIVGEDGKRYLFVNGVRRIRLTDDGLATDGELEQAYAPWQYPKDWVVEMFAPEGPKLLRRGEWFYLVTAVGGTSGPPTSHMVIAARSRSIHGPWEHCPQNPLLRTQSADEMWWSRGHATLVEGPAGDWWMVYHGYENGYRTLGRQTLLQPVEWTSDGWFKVKGGDLSSPLPMPRKGKAGPSDYAKSGGFPADKFGVQWSFFNPAPGEMQRVRFEDRAISVAGKGTAPANCSPLTFIVGDRAYEATVTLDISGGAQGGLLLHYSDRMFVGLGFSGTHMYTWNYGEEQSWMRTEMPTSTVHLRVRNDRHIVTFSYSHDGKNWTQHPWQMEVSGMHHNVLGGFLSLKVGVYSAGQGTVRMRDFRYRALNTRGKA